MNSHRSTQEKRQKKIQNVDMQSILNATEQGIFSLDLKGNTTFVNRYALKMLGYEHSEVIGKPQHALIHHTRPDGTHYPREECHIYAAFRDGKIHQETHEVFWRKDGTCFPVEYNSTPIVENGKIMGAVVTFSNIEGRKQLDKEKLRSEKLLKEIHAIQTRFFTSPDPQELFENLLNAYLELTESEYGFIGEVLYSKDNKPYLKTYAITNIAWTDELNEFYEQNAPQGLEFNNLDTLFGAALTSQEIVISNDPDNDPRAGGRPEGHPPLKAFLGLPLFVKDLMIGMVGIANRPQKYDENLISFLEPMTTTCSNLILAFQNQRRRNQFEQNLRRGEMKLKAILDNVVDGIITIDDKGIIEGFNSAAERIFGYTFDEVKGKNVRMLMPEPYASEHDTYLTKYQQSGIAKIIGIGREVLGLRKDGSTFPLNLGVSEMITEDQTKFIGMTRDITLLKRAKELREQLASIVENTEDAILGVQLDGTISLWNKAASRVFGYSEAEIIGEHLSIIIPPDYKAEADYVLEKIKRGETLNNFETKRVKKNGETFEVSLTVSPIRDDDGNVTGVSSIARDITEQKGLLKEKENLIQQLQEATNTDLLTGLFNRRGMSDRFDYEVARYMRTGRPLSILLADIDHFKRINDTYGHINGDLALKYLSQVLKKVKRTADTVCRWGGEEFLLLLPETDAKGAFILAQRIKEDLIDVPGKIQGKKINLTLSMGLSMLDEKHLEMEAIIKEADDCLYQAKEQGRDRVIYPERLNRFFE